MRMASLKPFWDIFSRKTATGLLKFILPVSFIICYFDAWWASWYLWFRSMISLFGLSFYDYPSFYVRLIFFIFSFIHFSLLYVLCFVIWNLNTHKTYVTYTYTDGHKHRSNEWTNLPESTLIFMSIFFFGFVEISSFF